MSRIVSFVKVWICNIIVMLFNIFIWRDKGVWLFGSWMGQKFSDNSRYLFQYLHENLEQYSLKKVVWVTNEQSVVEELSLLGYEVYPMKSIKGKYYHLKAGVHVICNSSANRNNQNDIDTYLSFGAIKIQLWHGVGIKAVGYMKNGIDDSIKQRIIDGFLMPYGKPGMWGKSYHLATSRENERVAMLDFHVPQERIIIANYPRLCHCLKLLPEEQGVINGLKKARLTGVKIVLFLPTFRDSSSNYVYPTSVDGFISFLHNKNILWVQKKHSADRNLDLKDCDNNILNLDSSFDINCLYDFIDLLITDYSSASSDATFKGVLTLEYCPDYDYYKNEDRGFVSDFEKYHVGHLVKSPDNLINEIEKCLTRTENDRREMQRVKNFLFDDHDEDYDQIVKSILKSTKIGINRHA